MLIKVNSTDFNICLLFCLVFLDLIILIILTVFCKCYRCKSVIYVYIISTEVSSLKMLDKLCRVEILNGLAS